MKVNWEDCWVSTLKHTFQTCRECGSAIIKHTSALVAGNPLLSRCAKGRCCCSVVICCCEALNSPPSQRGEAAQLLAQRSKAA